MTPLCALAEKHGTDKFAKHDYMPVYYSLLGARAGKIKRVLEVGIKRGASLRMWQEFFPNANIFGIDIKPTSMVNEGRIASYCGTQDDPSFLASVGHQITKDGPLDFIVDDAVHKAGFQRRLAKALLPFLAPDGVYVIEDVKRGPIDSPHTSIIDAMPKQFECRLVVTKPENRDSALIVIRRK